MSAVTLHLGWAHPLAQVASEHCADHSAPLMGGVACGACWELAIRDDERFAVQHDLPRELVADPELVDQVAVERASRGEPVPLTEAELRETIRRLHRTGLSGAGIVRLLDASERVVSQTLRAYREELRRDEQQRREATARARRRAGASGGEAA